MTSTPGQWEHHADVGVAFGLPQFVYRFDVSGMSPDDVAWLLLDLGWIYMDDGTDGTDDTDTIGGDDEDGVVMS